MPDVRAGHRGFRFCHSLCSKAIDFACIRADVEVAIGDSQSACFTIDLRLPDGLAVVPAEGIDLPLPTGKHQVCSQYQFRIALTWHTPPEGRSNILTAVPSQFFFCSF